MENCEVSRVISGTPPFSSFPFLHPFPPLCFQLLISQEDPGIYENPLSPDRSAPLPQPRLQAATIAVCSLPKTKTNKGARSRFHTFPKKASAETLPLVRPQLNPEEFGASSLKWSFCLLGL